MKVSSNLRSFVFVALLSCAVEAGIVGRIVEISGKDTGNETFVFVPSGEDNLEFKINIGPSSSYPDAYKEKCEFQLIVQGQQIHFTASQTNGKVSFSPTDYPQKLTEPRTFILHSNGLLLKGENDLQTLLIKRSFNWPQATDEAQGSRYFGLKLVGAPDVLTITGKKVYVYEPPIKPTTTASSTTLITTRQTPTTNTTEPSTGNGGEAKLNWTVILVVVFQTLLPCAFNLGRLNTITF